MRIPKSPYGGLKMGPRIKYYTAQKLKPNYGIQDLKKKRKNIRGKCNNFD